MTDKKQIIIDDVDVAGCKDYGYRGKAGHWCHNYDEPCTDYPNCYYKQLKRKERLIEKIESIVSEFEEVQSLYDDEVGVYLATGYLLSEENYFKLLQLLEDNE